MIFENSTYFGNCSSLEIVSFEEGSKLITIKDGYKDGGNTVYGAFTNCDNLTLFDASNCTQIKTIGNYAFKKVMMLYRFDKKLRLLMFNEIEKIEIAIRRAVMQITADMTGNPFWLTDSSYFLDSSKFNETMRAISKEYSKSKEEFILHFKRTYSEPYPPSWILGELLTIGNVNAIYRNIKQNRIRKRIAKRFGLPINVFESWLTVIAVTRNACGHHSRVWNKQNAIQPAIPNNPEGEWITLPTDSMRAYFDLCIIKYFLNV